MKNLRKIKNIVKITFLFVTVSVMLVAGYAAENVKEVFAKIEDYISYDKKSSHVELDRFYIGYRKVVIEPSEHFNLFQRQNRYNLSYFYHKGNIS